MRYNSLQYKFFPDETIFQEDERRMLIEHVLSENEIIVPNGPDSKLGRRLIYLFAKEAEHKTAMHVSNLVSVNLKMHHLLV